MFNHLPAFISRCKRPEKPARPRTLTVSAVVRFQSGHIEPAVQATIPADTELQDLFGAVSVALCLSEGLSREPRTIENISINRTRPPFPLSRHLTPVEGDADLPAIFRRHQT